MIDIFHDMVSLHQVLTLYIHNSVHDTQLTPCMTLSLLRALSAIGKDEAFAN